MVENGIRRIYLSATSHGGKGIRLLDGVGIQIGNLVIYVWGARFCELSYKTLRFVYAGPICDPLKTLGGEKRKSGRRTYQNGLRWEIVQEVRNEWRILSPKCELPDSSSTIRVDSLANKSSCFEDDFELLASGKFEVSKPEETSRDSIRAMRLSMPRIFFLPKDVNNQNLPHYLMLQDLVTFLRGCFLWIGVVMHDVPRHIQWADMLCKSRLSHLIWQVGRL